jgi:hypothetical protein
MTDPDYRALCAELVQDIEEWIVAVDHCPPSSSALVQRARAALAQPELQGPTDKELHQLWQELYGFHDGPTSGEANHVTTTTEINNQLELTASALQSCNKRLSSLLSLMRAERIQRKAL